MRVVVDATACEANERCVKAAPEVFSVDDDDCLQILCPNIPTELEEAVREAVDACPRRALRIEE